MSSTLLDKMSEGQRHIAPVKLIAIGGCGLSILDALNQGESRPVQTVAIDTDSCRLAETDSDSRLLLGESLTNGYGTGGDELLGTRSLNGKHVDVRDLLADSRANIILGGLGGGTATALLPELSKISRSLGVLTLVVASKPFKYEGFQKSVTAKRKMHSLVRNVDSLFIINNEAVVGEGAKLSASEAVKRSDATIKDTVKGLVEFLTPEKRMLLDFGTIKAQLTRGGLSAFASGISAMRNNAIEALKSAFEQFARHKSDITKAPRALIQFSIDANVLMDGVKNAFGVAQRVFNKDAQLSMGVVFNDVKQGKTQVSIVVSGLPLFNEVVDSELPLQSYRNLDLLSNTSGTGTRRPLRGKRFASTDAGNGEQQGLKNVLSRRRYRDTDGDHLTVLNPRLVDDEELRIPAYLRRRMLRSE